MTKLRCISGMNKGDEFELHEGYNTLGRAPDCDVRLFDKRVSRQHCRVLKRGKLCSLEDLSSRHGTILNGKDLAKRKVIGEGDKLIVGHTVLVLTEKPTGTALEQSLTETVEDLDHKDFHHLVEEAAEKAVETRLKNREKKGLFGFLFKKRWR